MPGEISDPWRANSVLIHAPVLGLFSGVVQDLQPRSAAQELLHDCLLSALGNRGASRPAWSRHADPRVDALAVGYQFLLDAAAPRPATSITVTGGAR